MNDFATLPVIVLLDGEGARAIVTLTRVPVPGEFIHIKDEGSITMGKVLAVTHLAWKDGGGDAVAEIHCVRVKESVPDRVRKLLADEERGQDYGL